MSVGFTCCYSIASSVVWVALEHDSLDLAVLDAYDRQCRLPQLVLFMQVGDVGGLHMLLLDGLLGCLVLLVVVLAGEEQPQVLPRDLAVAVDVEKGEGGLASLLLEVELLVHVC